jgi:hypothetical protein
MECDIVWSTKIPLKIRIFHLVIKKEKDITN